MKWWYLSAHCAWAGLLRAVLLSKIRYLEAQLSAHLAFSCTNAIEQTTEKECLLLTLKVTVLLTGNVLRGARANRDGDVQVQDPYENVER